MTDPELLKTLNNIDKTLTNYTQSTWARGGTVLFVLGFICLMAFNILHG
jgi:hypothetical protein